MKRRQFLASTAIAMPALLLGQTPSRKLRVAVAGMGGRGTSHAIELARLPDVEVAYVCDPDEKRAAAAAAAVEKRGFTAPKTARDFRALLDDRSIDGLSVATPNHWHAPAALLAMSAGKHVYLEKPCSHNAREGELLVEAARKHKRVVQHGTQRRSWPAIREAMQRLRSGELGAVRSARAYYFNARPSIGKGMAGPVPAGLDWSLWQGPAPEREFRTNFVHYNWHWFWHWGGGELANNGVHMLDLCRWGCGVDTPKHAASAGEKLGFPEDDQETPDTNTVTLDFGASTITWECRSWMNRTPLDPKHDVAFFCEKGTLLIAGNGYTIHDMKGVEVAKGTGSGDDKLHFQNWVDAIRDGARLNCEIEEGHKSTLLCHLGNIAWRNRKTVAPGDDTSKLHWSREYRPGWEPKV
jgi:predicted dehydrogenase